MDAVQTGECYNIGRINEWKNIGTVNLICILIDEQSTTHPELKTGSFLAA